MKKKILLAIMAMMLATALLVTGCNSISTTSSTQETKIKLTPVPTEEAASEESLLEKTAAPTEEVDSDQVQMLGTPFTADDTYVSDFVIGDDKDSVLALAGTPEKSYDFTFESTGEVSNINDYSFGSLIFVDDKLVVIQVINDSQYGPRGVKVGMQLNDVAELFASSVELDNEFKTIYYRANEGDSENFMVPPAAVLFKGESQTLAFSVFTENSGADEYTPEELAEGGYMFLEQYDFLCQFDAQGILESFAVRLGVPSE